MRSIGFYAVFFLFWLSVFTLSACSTYSSSDNLSGRYSSNNLSKPPAPPIDFAMRIPQHINTHENTVVVDPNVHVWGAYGPDGELVKAGQASAGADWCPDLGRRCHTRVGTFHVYS